MAEKLNGYQLQADSFRSYLERNAGMLEEEEKEMIRDEIRISETLAAFQGDDKYRAFNSSMFNDIMKGYVEKALDELIRDGGEDTGKAAERIRRPLMSRLHGLLDMIGAKEAETYYRNN